MSEDEIFYSHTPGVVREGHYVYGPKVMAFIFYVWGTKFEITKVDLYLERYYSLTYPDVTVGDFTCEIQEVNQSTLNPTGNVLTSAYENLDDLDNQNPEWVSFSFMIQPDLEANTYYAIVFHDAEYDNTQESREWVLWWATAEFAGAGGNMYTTGELRRSLDSGSTWTDGSEIGAEDSDLFFKAWGNFAFTGVIINPPLPTGMTVDEDGTPPDIYPGTVVGTPTGENNMITVRRLVAAANNKIWMEDV